MRHSFQNVKLPSAPLTRLSTMQNIPVACSATKPSPKLSKIRLGAVLALMISASMLNPMIVPTSAQTAESSVLTIGSPAPELDIEIWFSDREGELEHTTKFQPGKIYVIDFWATWSPISQKWISKFADLQDRHIIDNVQIISVTDEDEDSVSEFLDTDTSPTSKTIFAEVALSYCLTSDPDLSVYEDYMEAAQQKKRPTVFIVGKTGLIEFIGNPAGMRRPLKELIAGTWDRDAFKKEIDANRNVATKLIEIQRLRQADDLKAALKIVTEMTSSPINKALKKRLAMLQLELELQTDSDHVVQTLRLIAELNAEQPVALNDVAWTIVLRDQAGDNVSAEVNEVALELSYEAVKSTRLLDDENLLGAVLDTAAHLEHMRGNLEKAIELQTEASQLYPEEEIISFLDQLSTEADSKEKNSSPIPANQMNDSPAETDQKPVP